MQFDLIDTYWLFINPILLGQGIPFSGGLKEIMKLKLVSTDTFSSVVVCLHYERAINTIYNL
jgi:riboflavin biosynthesis pyrimidine reductase